jgi:ABC-type Zn2+ transport system substrate-binding protein/surface adhesin
VNLDKYSTRKNMATDAEILADIQNIYGKIDQCYKAKEDIAAQIAHEHDDILGLHDFMEEDLARIAASKKPRYDHDSMKANIQRIKNNIELFKQTILKEEESIAKFREIVKVLQEDMARPKEIIINLTSDRAN